MRKGLYKSIVCDNKKVGCNIYLTTFEIVNSKQQIADQLYVEPGQFLHLLCEDYPGFHLRRPFTVFSYFNENGNARVSILYEVVGRITSYLANCQKSADSSQYPLDRDKQVIDSQVPIANRNNPTTELLMPLGSPFQITDKNRAVFVSGGLGIAAFCILKEKIKSDTILLYGARSKEYIVDLNLFKSSFTEVQYSTDDGSLGKKGFVTALLEEDLKKYVKESMYYICGPDPMMATCFFLLKKHGAKAQFSLENKMGCALNVCRACVVKLKDEKSRKFTMATCCTDGPNFSIEQFPDTGWW